MPTNEFLKNYRRRLDPALDYHPRHLCRNCGSRFEEHAAAGNPDCPEGRCPGRRFPTFPKAISLDLVTEEKLTEQLRAFWNERSTVFSPS